ncbi:putative short-chain dehydrogenase/reductase family 42E member 2-like protein [Corchorus capsularis]|uniref:Putative short-chain dehydrogenase/reductase family 42E member 2-like protein n=1 Tax=Corchorus capsularis TaxID=210143 RepID=A0A1R3J425_COCAP|nr:putative short-chain dehydrogenase/reductase family 42E member 2-like protein [Corchorus capsularis]
MVTRNQLKEVVKMEEKEMGNVNEDLGFGFFRFLLKDVGTQYPMTTPKRAAQKRAPSK